MQSGKTVTGKIQKYTVVFEPDKVGGYVISVPALPGCVTQGETDEENLSIPVETEEPVVTKIAVPFPFQIAV